MRVALLDGAQHRERALHLALLHLELRARDRDAPLWGAARAQERVSDDRPSHATGAPRRGGDDSASPHLLRRRRELEDGLLHRAARLVEHAQRDVHLDEQQVDRAAVVRGERRDPLVGRGLG